VIGAKELARDRDRRRHFDSPACRVFFFVFVLCVLFIFIFLLFVLAFFNRLLFFPFRKSLWSYRELARKKKKQTRFIGGA